MTRSVDDELLRERVERAIRRDERLSSQRVHVEVRTGRVRLRGTVASYRRRLAAVRIASAFDGCREVVDELQVQPSIEPDPEVAEAVRASLDACADLTRETITVSARNGVVILTGHLASPWERVLAMDIALGVRGVREVENQIIVDPPKQERDEALAHDLDEILAHTSGLADADLQVAVNSAAIVLSGTVPRLWQKELAESVAARFMPCVLRNEIVVET